MLLLFYQKAKIKSYCQKLLFQKKTIGFVPTMGSLHKGHLSMIEKAKKENDVVVVSIFVNPTQFEAHEDYEFYPKNIQKDTKKIEALKVDILFIPSKDDIYENKQETIYITSLLTKLYCGIFRPHHFEGVLKIIAKLFHIINPSIAYFGQKDYQQFILIKKMIQELDFFVKIKACTTIRDKNGLALSSRNEYLNYEEKKIAANIYASLKEIKKINEKLNIKEIKKKIKNFLKMKKKLKIDYISLVNKHTLETQEETNHNSIILIAVYYKKARLIDNITLNI